MPSIKYIKELRQFHQEMWRRPLPAAAQLLWYKLMAEANLRYWPEWLVITNDQLSRILGVSSSCARDARDVLAKAGYIVYEQGDKFRQSRYHIVTADERKAETAETEEDQDVLFDQKETEENNGRNVHEPRKAV